MRTDTPQRYEFVTVEDIEGRVGNVLLVWPWSQFADLQGRTTPPVSYGTDVIMRRLNLSCKQFMRISPPDELNHLERFIFEDIKVETDNGDIHPEYFKGLTMKNVCVNGNLLPNLTENSPQP